ncbi:DUF1501 domain-containing protein [Cystobacter ferrugineus]|uniref:Tat pathway signal protein n=1 Tax=Cystobacter ferrugineus TaxID=83449 RepID=A0A1L9BCH3_9BACT|nr:DUF1501 domain-containing protein [Cystobacter ferrugineus]OJH39918.1 hypothetical protein BON30_12590 [Cystobacter ferrugineus]
MKTSRRQFLRATGLLAAAATLPRWLGEANAASVTGYSGYRAAICVNLLGGNDSNNLLVPRLETPHAQYLAARPNIGIKQADLLPINPLGLAVGSYGLHPSLPKLQALFEQERAAVVCNVGPLVLPMNKSDYASGTVERPENLFSHEDQQEAWASGIANPSSVTLPLALIGKSTGWGGRTADKIHGLNTGEYPEVTLFSSGGVLFAEGASRRPLMVAANGALGVKETTDAAFNALQRESLAQVLAIHNGATLAASYGGTFALAQSFASSRTTAREAAWTRLPQATRDAIEALFVPPNAGGGWSLHTQLYQVLRDLVAAATPVAQGGLGLKRQLFSVSLGGFDTHIGQDTTQASLFSQLDFSLDAFYRALMLVQGAFGSNAPQATLFTMSDFSRTFVENSNRGTDHGWGSHAIVLGDRVAGRQLYGTFPNLDLSNNAANNLDTVDEKGRWIPTLSVDQYAHSIAQWMGLSTTAERDYVFPNINDYLASAVARGFPAAAQSASVGFMMSDV